MADIIIVDSTEKCAGTTIKQLLRRNFPQECFFDYDNGDPPGMTERDYGIKCGIYFQPPADIHQFDTAFIAYLDRRSAWLADNCHRYDIRCVYGNGLFAGKRSITELLTNAGKRPLLNKFLREPFSRVRSEYYYCRGHDSHPLHWIAAECDTLADYLCAETRPKNRMCESIIGPSTAKLGDLAVDILFAKYNFVGFVETYDESIAKFCDLYGLQNRKSPRLNENKEKPARKQTDDDAIRDLIRETDAEDHLLYQEAVKAFG
jgi:hypothetical protein